MVSPPAGPERPDRRIIARVGERNPPISETFRLNLFHRLSARPPVTIARVEHGPALDQFTFDQVERARRYHRPLYAAMAGGFVLSVALLALLAFGWPGHRLGRALQGLPWWGATPAWVGIVVGLEFAAGLPLSFWRGYLREKRWGFSTQRLSGWIADRLKGLAVGLVLAPAAVLGFVGLARALPGAWPWAVAPAAAGLVLLLSFVAPAVLEPLFNRFEPLADERLAGDLLALSERCGVPVREVLVADASRRTRKENAYVSGLGRTRRVVVFDTLLSRADPAELRLVVAHELGHRRLRHVAKGTLLGVAGIVGAVAALWLLLRPGAVLRAAGAASAGDPRVVPLVVLAAASLQLLVLPFESGLSRRWESAADRFSLDMTGDVEVFVRTHRALAVSNLADLDPPRWTYLAVFTHPTPPERMAAALAQVRGPVSPSRPTTA